MPTSALSPPGPLDRGKRLTRGSDEVAPWAVGTLRAFLCPFTTGRKCPERQGYKCPELQGYKRRLSTAQNRDSSPSLTPSDGTIAD